MRVDESTLAHPPKRGSDTSLFAGLIAATLFLVPILGTMVISAGIAAYQTLHRPQAPTPSAPVPPPPAEAVVPDGPDRPEHERCRRDTEPGGGCLS